MTIHYEFKQSPYNNRGWTGRQSERKDGHSIVYPSFRGESMLQNLENRRLRPHAAMRPYVLEALREAGIPFKNIRWSQKAGCSCPCSPGWIIQGGDKGKDYWITFTDEELRTA